MKKLKLIPGLILLALCVAVLGVGIYAAAPANNTITGTVSVTAANAEVSIALYDTPTDYNPDAVGYQFGDGTTKKGNTRTGLSLSYSAVEFDASSANVASDVAPVTKLIVVKNNSTTKHLGVYFQDKTGSNTIHALEQGWVSGGVPEQATMTYDNSSYNVTASDILYGNVTTHYNASELNNVVQLNCSFYSHLAPSATVEMLVQFSLIDLDSTVSSTSLNLYLNVEEYQPSDSDETEGFVKWDPDDMPDDVIESNSVIGPESSINGDLVNPNGGGNQPMPDDPYEDYSSGLVALVIPTTNNHQFFGFYSEYHDSYWGFMHGCTKLVAVSIPNSTTTLYPEAFKGCSALTSIIIPSNTSICLGNDRGESVEVGFKDCTNLSTIIVNPKNAEFNSGNGCNAIITSTSITFGEGKYECNVGPNLLIRGCNGTTIIPNTVTAINEEAFKNCTGLTSITIPSSVTRIGASAFAGCTGLTSVVNNGTLSPYYTLPTKSGYHWEFNGGTVTSIASGVAGQGTYTLVAN